MLKLFPRLLLKETLKRVTFAITPLLFRQEWYWHTFHHTTQVKIKKHFVLCASPCKSDSAGTTSLPHLSRTYQILVVIFLSFFLCFCKRVRVFHQQRCTLFFSTSFWLLMFGGNVQVKLAAWWAFIHELYHVTGEPRQKMEKTRLET